MRPSKCAPHVSLSRGHTANSQLREHPNGLSWFAAGQRGRKAVSFGGFWGVGGDVWEKVRRKQHRRCLAFDGKNKSLSRGSKLSSNACQWLSLGFLLVDTSWYFPWVQALFKTLQTDFFRENPLMEAHYWTYSEEHASKQASFWHIKLRTGGCLGVDSRSNWLPGPARHRPRHSHQGPFTRCTRTGHHPEGQTLSGLGKQMH